MNMITYYCHFGDSLVGENFKKIIFGNVKIINLIEEKIKKVFETSVLIRYYLDGVISQYNDVEDKTIIFDKKKNVIVLNFRLSKEEVLTMSLLDSFQYIKKSTMNGLSEITNKFGISFQEISNHLLDVFDIIEKQNLNV